MTDLSDSEILSELQDLESSKFEHLIADLWERMGRDTKVTAASGDAGIDIISTIDKPYPRKELIQAKRYGENTTVGGPAVQQYASLQHQVSDADSVIIVTTSSFTQDAIERAQDLNVKTIDGPTLLEIIEDVSGYAVVEEYIDTPEEVSEKEPETTAISDTYSKGRKNQQGEIEEGRKNIKDSPPCNSKAQNKEPSNSTEKKGSLNPIYRNIFLFGILSFYPLFILTTLHSVVEYTIASVILSILVYFDIEGLRETELNWNPSSEVYISSTLFLWIITVPIYVLRRIQVVSSERTQE